MYQFLFIVSMFAHGINRASACGNHPIKYSISKLFNYEYTVVDMEQKVITSFEHAYSIKMRQPVKKLCREILDIKQLTHFFWLNDGLEDIESGTFASQNLTEGIYLSGNKLKTIKKNTFSNLEVYEIQLNDNQISTIEEGAFNNLKNLITLTLGDNKLTQISPKYFVNTPNIVSLFINNNKIEKISGDALSFLSHRKVVDLDLARNIIVGLDKEALKGVKVVQLNLTGNQLTTIFNENFYDDLEILDLSYNKLKVLPQKLFNLKKLKNIHLENNDFDCPTEAKISSLAHSLNIHINFDHKC